MWRSILKENFHNISKLLDYLELSPENREKVLTKSSFVLNVPKRLAQKIKKNDITDPLFLQFVPLKKEDVLGFSKDPLKEIEFQETEKLLSKYPSRSLIITTSACAMNCRFCFRRNFPYETERKDFNKELDLLRNDSNIKEVILSGGDPLALSDERLFELLKEIDSISHVERIRFHTRFQIGIPERITLELVNNLKQIKKAIWWVIHVNHPLEIDSEVEASIRSLKSAGVSVLSQTVFLKGVNDSEETLEALLVKLSNSGVQPYYLHQLDQVEGTNHFEALPEKGIEILENLSNRLSGFMIPRFVKEIPHKPKKSPLHSLNRLNT